MAKFSPKTLHLKGEEITLREGTPADAQSLIDFMSTVATETPFTYLYPGQQWNAEKVAAHLGALSSSTILRLLAVAGDRIVGSINLWQNHPDHPWLQHRGEFSMMVVKEWWGTGLAKELLRTMEAVARAAGLKRIDATVNTANERGVGLYVKNGFVIEGTAKAYKIVDGKPLDSHFIAKLL